MPVATIEVPKGADAEAKRRLLKEVTEAIHETWRFPDTRVFLHESDPENVSQDGRVGEEPVRPVCFLEAPQLTSLDARRTLVCGIERAIEGAYRGLANTDETLVLLNEYPLENAGYVGQLQSDNAEVVAAIEQLNG